MQFFGICVCLPLLGCFGAQASTSVSHLGTPHERLTRVHRSQEAVFRNKTQASTLVSHLGTSNKRLMRKHLSPEALDGVVDVNFIEEPHKFASLQTVPSEVFMRNAGTEKPVHGANMSIQPAYSQLYGFEPVRVMLGHSQHVGRFLSYARGTSVGMFAAVVLFAFVLGMVSFFVMASFMNSSDASSTSDHRSQSLLDHVVDQVDTLVQDNTTLHKVFDQVDDLVWHSQGHSDSDADEPRPPRPEFDFETSDGSKLKRWQWCTQDEIQQFGILTEAPTQHFEGYKRVDVTLTQEGVKDVLMSSNVDFTVFDFSSDGEDLLSQLLRTNAYFMLFDADSVSRQVLVMMQTVCLRWVYDGRILIQKKLLAPGLCLPVQERPCSDSPMATAKKIWQETFNLSADIVDFVVDSVQENEIVHYKGLRCVERSHIVDVQLRTLPDTAVVNTVGLPNFADFSSTVGGEVNGFTWMTMDECKASGVKLTDYRVFKPLRRARSLMLEETGESKCVEVKEFLEQAGVDVESPIWQNASRGSSRLEELSKEVASGKSHITNTSDGLNRCVNVVALRVWSPDRKLMLVERGHKHASGEEEWNTQLPGIKRHNNESLKEVIWQVLEQQLKLKVSQVSLCDDSDWEYFEYSETSRRYVGVVTKYQKTFVDVVLDEENELCDRVGLSGLRGRFALGSEYWNGEASVSLSMALPAARASFSSKDST